MTSQLYKAHVNGKQAHLYKITVVNFINGVLISTGNEALLSVHQRNAWAEIYLVGRISGLIVEKFARRFADCLKVLQKTLVADRERERMQVVHITPQNMLKVEFKRSKKRTESQKVGDGADPVGSHVQYCSLKQRLVDPTSGKLILR